MTKKSIITIAGRLGSGKSTTAKALASNLGYQHFSSGDLFREIAAEQSMDVLSANQNAEKDADIDHKVDARLREIGESEQDRVIDSRTAWHWIPQSFKVYLDIDTRVAAERIMANRESRLASANETMPETIDEYVEHLEARYASENKRYESLYGINPSLPDNYDLIVSTAEHNLDEVLAIIEQAYRQWQAN